MDDSDLCLLVAYHDLITYVELVEAISSDTANNFLYEVYDADVDLSNRFLLEIYHRHRSERYLLSA